VAITALLTVVNLHRFNAAFVIRSTGFSEGMVCVLPIAWRCYRSSSSTGWSRRQRALARSALVAVATPRGLLREANATVNVIFTVNGSRRVRRAACSWRWLVLEQP
jgi:hypothetical protein